ncbi:NitT/TauT family transport system ATP-binding protein [Natronocella acetinitrilica]|uniref:NitT/TauT family transport system ATP-binding protein n=1 Tax=Natronocella acetinitrilica TaxID=414046 RepID=A0AAE3G589_9GAMM|nr:ABC transporter ATP-binding protein [Natronocella acetinitrilica]MCP1676050.1 NitT/TauT family transport system ATP-binding protein [Natronocella acetinitrilica]
MAEQSARENRVGAAQADREAPVAAATGASRPFVSFQDVSLAYDDSGNAIEDISLTIDEGEFVAFVGPSGCGKSTFMKLCTGLRPPTTGKVEVDGKPVTGPLKISGMAFQNATLLPWRTTLDNVLLPLEIVEPYRRRFRRDKAKFVEQAKALLRTVGLEGYEHQYPWQLSGGMQQRASICRALVHEPRLLMLDEPFAALDAFTREELWCVLRDLWEAQRFTVVLVTHDLREAVFLADTVYVMSKRPGRIIDTHRIDLERPRGLEVTYSEPFTNLVHGLRAQIGEIRGA